MKKLIVLLICLSSLVATGQSWKQYYYVQTKNTRFGVAVPNNQVVFLADSSAYYKLTQLRLATDSMVTAFTQISVLNHVDDSFHLIRPELLH